MTKEELEKSPMFRVVKRSLLRKYPFIKDVIIDDEIDKYESMWFVDLIIDANQANELYNLGGLNEFVNKRYFWNKDQEYYDAVYLSLYFTDTDKSRDLQREMENDVRHVQRADITKEFRLPKTFGISNFKHILPPYEETKVTT